jgi:hypothetical protein
MKALLVNGAASGDVTLAAIALCLKRDLDARPYGK